MRKEKFICYLGLHHSQLQLFQVEGNGTCHPTQSVYRRYDNDSYLHELSSHKNPVLY